MSGERTKAEAACLYVVRRITSDGMLAYLMGPYTEAYNMVTEAAAETLGRDVDEYRRELEQHIRPIAIQRREAP